jgi:ABC-2 type transport system ATP-binding protein
MNIGSMHESEVLVLTELTKFYRGRVGRGERPPGIEGLTLSMQRGEILGLLGPNGAGKTTLMRILVGLIRPTCGTAVVLGQDISGPGRGPVQVRSRIGYLPGTLAMYRNLTGQAFLTLFARLRGCQASAEITALSERLDADLTRRIGELSRGNVQKLGVIAALMHQPELLILDEPTSGLDPLVQREFEALLTEHRLRGGSTLLSSHLLSEVEHQADRVAILHRGRLRAVQTIESLRSAALRSLELDFPDPVPAAAFAAIPGVLQVQANGNVLTCQVRGSEHSVLRVAVDHGVHSVHSHEPSLEEAFLNIISASEDGYAVDHPAHLG